MSVTQEHNKLHTNKNKRKMNKIYRVWFIFCCMCNNPVFCETCFIILLNVAIVSDVYEVYYILFNSAFVLFDSVVCGIEGGFHVFLSLRKKRKSKKINLHVSYFIVSIVCRFQSRENKKFGFHSVFYWLYYWLLH